MQRNVLTIFSLYDVNVLFVKSGVKERERILPEVKIILNNVRETLQDKYKNQKSKKKEKKLKVIKEQNMDRPKPRCTTGRQ